QLAGTREAEELNVLPRAVDPELGAAAGNFVEAIGGLTAREQYFSGGDVIAGPGALELGQRLGREVVDELPAGSRGRLQDELISPVRVHATQSSEAERRKL